MGQIAKWAGIGWQWIAHLSTAQWFASLFGVTVVGGLTYIDGQPAWLIGFVALGAFAFISIIWSRLALRKAAQRPFGPSNDAWIESYRPPSASTEISGRDTPLAEGLAYAVTGKWDGSLPDDTAEAIEGLSCRLGEFEQAASEGGLAVWGKELILGNHASSIWEPVPKEHWKYHRVKWFSIFDNDDARTELRGMDSRGLGQRDEPFAELMISKAQFERHWPHD